MYVRVDSQLGQALPRDDNLAGAADPVAVSAVAGALPEVDSWTPLPLTSHPRQQAVPPVTPRVAVVVPREQRDEARRRGDGPA